MGVIFSRYLFSRRKKTPLEVLEGLEEDIVAIEDSRQVTLQRQQKIIGHLVIYSILIYVISALIFYFWCFPASLKDRIFYMIPLLVFPIIVILLKRLVTWYYKREIVRTKDKLADLRAQKKKILDEVMDKETFKVAKEILEKFAPDQLNKTLPREGGKPKVAAQIAKSVSQAPPAQAGPGSSQPLQNSQGSPSKSDLTNVPNFPRPTPFTTDPQHQPQPARLIRPVLPQNRSYMDRLVEAIVGDGPSNRYALICKNCATHNGMALREEFEYIAFRCVYCGFPNPARKRRPVINTSLERQQQHSEPESEDDRASRHAGDEEKHEYIMDSKNDSEGENKLDPERDTPEKTVENGIKDDDDSSLIQEEVKPEEKKIQ